MGTGAFTLCRYSCRGKRLLESTTGRLRRAAEPSTAVDHPAEHTLSGVLSTRSCTDPATLERGASRLRHPDQCSVTGRLEPSLDRPYRPQGASHRSRRPWAGHAGFNLGCYSYLGRFTTLYPVRLEAQNTLNDSIKTIKEHLRKIPNKGVGYGAVMGCEPSVLPNISFNY